MKKLLALVLSVVMVLGMGFSAFALSDVAGTTYEDAINYFVEHGIINGYEDGTFKPEGTLTRAEMTKILVCALGYEEEANALKGDTKFTDVSPKADWASGYINLAVDKGIVEGVTDSTFAPSEPVTTGQLVAMVLRALGVEFEQTEGADWYVGAMAKAAELQLVAADADGAAPAARGLTMDILYNSLDVKMADGTTLRIKIEGIDTSVLDVVSATATNLLEVDVVFNVAVDATTVEADCFELQHEDGGAPAVSKAEVLEDGKTVRLTTAANLTNQENYTVKVSDLKSAAGQALQNATATFSVQDFTAPEATAIRFVGPNAVEVTFSEPVKGTGEVNIDNGAYMGSATADGSRTVTVNFGRNISAGAHEVRVSAFKDVAGFSMINKTFNVDYQPVTVPVTATVKAIDQKSFTLEFSQPVSIDTTKDVEYFYHTYTGWSATQLQDEDGDPLTNGYYSVVKASFEARPNTNDTERFIPVGTATVGVLSNDSMKDRWGNKIDGTLKLTANVTADTTAPTVTSVKASDENTIKITFSEAVLNADLTKVSNYTVKDSKGEEVYFYIGGTDSKDNKSAKSVTLKFNEDLSGDYTVDVKGIKDASVSENEMAPYSATVNVSDMTALSVSKITYSTNNDGKISSIYVKYSEAPATTGSYSALDKNNYVVTVNNNTLDADDFTVNLYSESIVRIVLDDAADVGTVTVAVGRIADVAGNVPTAFNLWPASAPEKEAGPEVDNGTAIQFVDGRTFVITLNDTLQSVDTTKISAYDRVAKADARVSGISYENKDGKAKVTVTLTQNQAFSSALRDADKITDPKALEESDVVVKFGEGAFRGSTGVASSALPNVELGANKATLEDKMAPEVEEDAKGDAVITATKNQIQVTYTEKLEPSSVYIGTYTVSGRDITSVSVKDNVVTINLKNVTNTGASVTVAQPGTVQDLNGNEYSTTSSWTVKYSEEVVTPDPGQEEGGEQGGSEVETEEPAA